MSDRIRWTVVSQDNGTGSRHQAPWPYVRQRADRERADRFFLYQTEVQLKAFEETHKDYQPTHSA